MLRKGHPYFCLTGRSFLLKTCGHDTLLVRKGLLLMIDGKQKVLALAAHIGYLFFGVGYILVPLVLYLIYDKQDAFIAQHAKQALMAQAIFGVVSAVVTGLTVLLIGLFLWPLLLLLGGVWFCCSIIACFKVINEKEYHYPLLGRF